jgi:hypothetical protein
VLAPARYDGCAIQGTSKGVSFIKGCLTVIGSPLGAAQTPIRIVFPQVKRNCDFHRIFLDYLTWLMAKNAAKPIVFNGMNRKRLLG